MLEPLQRRANLTPRSQAQGYFQGKLEADRPRALSGRLGRRRRFLNMPTPIYRAGARGQRWDGGGYGSQCGRAGAAARPTALSERLSVTSMLLRTGVCAPAQSFSRHHERLVYVTFLFQRHGDDDERRNFFSSPWIKNENTIQARFIVGDLFLVPTVQTWPRDSQQLFVLFGFESRPIEASAPPPGTGGSRDDLFASPPGFILKCSQLATVRCQPVFTPSARPRYQVTVARSPASSAICGRKPHSRSILEQSIAYRRSCPGRSLT